MRVNQGLCGASVGIVVLFLISNVLGQCMLANPSFEIIGSGAIRFAGWNQFGTVGRSYQATHGHLSARVSGPNLGGWDVSGYWQALDTSPGERWAASVKCWHTSTNPLTGQSRAILNIEWRNSSGDLISYESYTVADSSTPQGEVQDFYVESGPAPEGTVSTRLLLGVLQAPGQPSPDVYYDQATFENMGPPTLDEIQWNDFPGGRTIEFSGYSWRVKGPGYYGPGPSLYSDSPTCVWVDAQGRLHLTIKKIGTSWYSTEVALVDYLGYGDYIFTTLGRIDLLDPHAVFGLFLWQYGRCYDTSYLWWNPYNEMDIEFGRWANPNNPIGQFVVQPWDYPGNISYFNAVFSENQLTSHAFRWLPDKVEFRSWRGAPEDESPENMIHSWTYTGPHIARPEQPRVHINLWQFDGPPSSNQEVIIDRFTFVSSQGGAGVDEHGGQVSRVKFSSAFPNPFVDETMLVFEVLKGGMTSVEIYSVKGELVRKLDQGFLDTGTHCITWNGCDQNQAKVAPGVYFWRICSGHEVLSKKVVLLR